MDTQWDCVQFASVKRANSMYIPNEAVQVYARMDTKEIHSLPFVYHVILKISDSLAFAMPKSRVFEELSNQTHFFLTFLLSNVNLITLRWRAYFVMRCCRLPSVWFWICIFRLAGNKFTTIIIAFCSNAHLKLDEFQNKTAPKMDGLFRFYSRVMKMK